MAASFSSTTSRKPLFYVGRWRRLNWRSHAHPIPHGASGMAALLLGSISIAHNLSGKIDIYELSAPQQQHHEEGNDDDYISYFWRMMGRQIPWLVGLYTMATLATAVSGYRMVRLAPKSFQATFRSLAIFQACLCFFIIRFLPHFTIAWREFGNVWPEGAGPLGEFCLWAVDAGVTALACYSTGLIWWAGVRVCWSKNFKPMVVGITVGCLAICLFLAYPVQLVERGQGWYECIQTRYPHQASGMVGYIYVPATLAFSLIVFAATLKSRGIMSDVLLGVLFPATVMLCLVGSVLSQEYYIPFVSTQRIYLPCHDPAMGTLEQQVVEALDFSRHSQFILSHVFEVDFTQKIPTATL